MRMLQGVLLSDLFGLGAEARKQMTEIEFDSALENLRGYSRWAGRPTVLEIAADELERMRAALKWYAPMACTLTRPALTPGTP